MNEGDLLLYLRDLDVPIVPARLHHLTALTLLACHDRNVQREFLVDVLVLAEEMADTASIMDRAAVIGQTVAVLDTRKRLDPEEAVRLPKLLDQRYREACRTFTRQRLKLADFVEQLLQCPDSPVVLN